MTKRALGVAAVFAALAFILASAPAAAQSGNGQIEGVVKDAQGGLLPGVTVTLRNQASGVQRTVDESLPNRKCNITSA